MKSSNTKPGVLCTTSKYPIRRIAERSLTSYSDDPWNQTAADNVQWLQQFKQDVGILDANDPNAAKLSGLHI